LHEKATENERATLERESDTEANKLMDNGRERIKKGTGKGRKAERKWDDILFLQQAEVMVKR
jgi:hypothetical protein